jgi:hypothetical protein
MRRSWPPGYPCVASARAILLVAAFAPRGVVWSRGGFQHISPPHGIRGGGAPFPCFGVSQDLRPMSWWLRPETISPSGQSLQRDRRKEVSTLLCVDFCPVCLTRPKGKGPIESGKEMRDTVTPFCIVGMSDFHSHCARRHKYCLGCKQRVVRGLL